MNTGSDLGGPCITYKRWLCIQILEILPVPVWMDVLGYYANFWSGIRCEVVGFGHRRRRAPWSNGIFRHQLSVKLTFDPDLGNRQGERICTVDLVTQNKLWSICGRRLGGLEGKIEWLCGVRESDQWENSEGEKQTLMLLVVMNFAGPTQLLGRRDGWFVVGLGAGLRPCPAGRVGRWWGRM